MTQLQIDPFSWDGKLSLENLEDVCEALQIRLQDRRYTLIDQNTFIAENHRDEYSGIQLRDEDPIHREQQDMDGFFHVFDTSPYRVWGARTDSNTFLRFDAQTITVSHNVGDGDRRQTITLITS